jgi:hypothetical protein
MCRGEKEMAQCQWRVRKCGGRYFDHFKNIFLVFSWKCNVEKPYKVSGHTGMPKNLDQEIQFKFTFKWPII